MGRTKKIVEPLEIPEVQLIQNDSLESSETLKETEMAKEVKSEETTNMQEVSVTFETEGKVYDNPNDILFCVKYPKDYKGNKYVPEGDVIISKETAEIFIKKGIGKIVK